MVKRGRKKQAVGPPHQKLQRVKGSRRRIKVLHRIADPFRVKLLIYWRVLVKGGKKCQKT